MDQVSNFYNQQVFKQSHQILKLSSQVNCESEIRNFFFLLERGFYEAFNLKSLQNDEKNRWQIYRVLQMSSDTITRKLVKYAFQNLIKQSMQNVLKSTYNSGIYLSYLQIFYSQSKMLLKRLENLINDEKIINLMSTYLESVFDTYLQSYLQKQIHFLSNQIQDLTAQISDDIKNSKLFAKVNFQVETTKKFSIKKIMDFKIQQKVINPEALKMKTQALMNIFMTPNLQKIFMTIKQSLSRNNKIAKMNQMDRNRTEMLFIFINSLGEVLDILISSIAQIVPGFADKSLALEPEFFQIVPKINLILQRMQFIFIENQKQSKYRLSESLKLQQKKQKLITSCEKRLNKIIGDALANILTIENALLKSNENQYNLKAQGQKQRQAYQSCSSKVISFLQKYLRTINKINLSTYRSTLLKQIGFQFLTLLTSHYSQITFTKEGLGKIFIDLANYKKIISQIDFPQIQEKYQSFRSLIDSRIVTAS